MRLAIHRLDGQPYFLNQVPESYEKLETEILSRLDLSSSSTSSSIRLIWNQTILTPETYPEIPAVSPEGVVRIWVLLSQKEPALQITEEMLLQEFPVYLRMVDGRAVKDTVKTVTSVHKLKKNIVNYIPSLGQKAANQFDQIAKDQKYKKWVLLYKGVELSNIDALLLYYEIQSTCVIHAVHRPEVQTNITQSPTINLICAEKGVNCSILVSQYPTLGELQLEIEKTTAIPVSEQLLLYLGAVLTEDRYPGSIVREGQLFVVDRNSSSVKNHVSQSQWFLENARKKYEKLMTQKGSKIVVKKIEAKVLESLSLKNIGSESTLNFNSPRKAQEKVEQKQPGDDSVRKLQDQEQNDHQQAIQQPLPVEVEQISCHTCVSQLISKDQKPTFTLFPDGLLTPEYSYAVPPQHYNPSYGMFDNEVDPHEQREEVTSLPNQSIPPEPLIGPQHLLSPPMGRLGQNIGLTQSITYTEFGSEDEPVRVVTSSLTQSTPINRVNCSEISTENNVSKTLIPSRITEINSEQSVFRITRSDVQWGSNQILIYREEINAYFTTEYQHDKTVLELKQRLEGSHSWSANQIRLFCILENDTEWTQMEEGKRLYELNIRPGSTIKMLFK